jgi:hypothetical protein
MLGFEELVQLTQDGFTCEVFTVQSVRFITAYFNMS